MTMRSDESSFWDDRYRREGVIWGEAASVTAQRALSYLPANARVLEIGFGYGRDLVFFVRQGYRVWGIDLSSEAHRLAEARLQREGLAAERLLTGSFQDNTFPEAFFEGVFSHRMAHLLVTNRAVECFADQVRRILRPGGLLCLSVRNTEDRNPAEVRRVGDRVYEYLPRPNHWIRFWDDVALRNVFGNAFTFLAIEQAFEDESRGRPVPCHLTVLIGRKIDAMHFGGGPTVACTGQPAAGRAPVGPETV
jgi:SAM-dependent methyltransferase